MNNGRFTLKIAYILSGCLGYWGCHSSPPPTPPAPEPLPFADTDTGIPEVVTNKIDLTDADFSGCQRYEEAGNKIWSYPIQVELNLTVRIYEGKIIAGDAENLVQLLNRFGAGWKGRFKTLCENVKKDDLAPGQYDSAVRCLSDLLDTQKDYVNSLFHNANFTVDEAAALGEKVTECDDLLVPRGKELLKDNPF